MFPLARLKIFANCKILSDLLSMFIYRFLYVMPTLLKVYSNNQPNPVICGTIQFVCRQFYILHRKPFMLQVFWLEKTSDKCILAYSWKNIFWQFTKKSILHFVQLISTFAFAAKIVQYIWFSCLQPVSVATAQFVSDLIGNPIDRSLMTQLIFFGLYSG